MSCQNLRLCVCSISDSRVHPGVHGMCLQHHSFIKSNAVLCKCIGVVDIDNTIPIQLLNATDTPIVISRGTEIASFTPFDQEVSYLLSKMFLYRTFATM